MREGRKEGGKEDGREGKEVAAAMEAQTMERREVCRGARKTQDSVDSHIIKNQSYSSRLPMICFCPNKQYLLSQTGVLRF